MKKISRASQFEDVLGDKIPGIKIHLHGLHYLIASRIIFPRHEDAIDRIHIAVEKFPEIHLVTHLDEHAD